MEKMELIHIKKIKYSPHLHFLLPPVDTSCEKVFLDVSIAKFEFIFRDHWANRTLLPARPLGERNPGARRRRHHHYRQSVRIFSKAIRGSTSIRSLSQSGHSQICLPHWRSD